MFYDFFERDILKINSKVNFWCEWYFLWFLWIHFLLSVYLIEFFSEFFSDISYWLYLYISLTNIFWSEFLLTELFEWFLCFFFIFLIPFFSVFFSLYLSGVVSWGNSFVVFFLWIFWVIIFEYFFKRVLCYEEINILSLNIFYKWFIKGFIIFLCTISLFIFLMRKGIFLWDEFFWGDFFWDYFYWMFHYFLDFVEEFE